MAVCALEPSTQRRDLIGRQRAIARRRLAEAEELSSRCGGRLSTAVPWNDLRCDSTLPHYAPVAHGSRRDSRHSCAATQWIAHGHARDHVLLRIPDSGAAAARYG